ncbi:hypothetical protein THOM_2070 [Trachipleistophora hominis]|uniref:Uncharacterized protein n=1 Tax=Trachipleistophora hominis TaxID=72359 RepID=L7JVA6_TRAHO|nr:hypothetical protein THOM_2070 [Trachipleistophora hominis]
MANDYQALRKFAFKFKFKRKGYKMDQNLIDICDELVIRYAKVRKKLKKYRIRYDPEKTSAKI